MTFESFNEEYVRRLTNGDPEAGNHFASYFGNALYLKLRVRLRSFQQIEDVRQETLTRVLAILRQGGGVKCPERFGAFVNGVCNNVVLEHCRRNLQEEAWDDNFEEPSDPSANLDKVLVSADLRRIIEQVFAELQERDRRILQAIYIEEIRKEEICRLFEIEASYLRVLLHRARAQFRRAYETRRAAQKLNQD